LALVKTVPAHEAAVQTVPLGYFWQAPLPSQKPVAPQDAALWAAHSLSGSTPAAMRPQTPFTPEPFLAAEQAWQSPVHAASQQRPSTQKPLAQSLGRVQAAPPVRLYSSVLATPVNPLV
jgi:hypothetical protein